MTPEEAVGEGRYHDALVLQQAIVESAPDDASGHRLLVELLALTGRIDEALIHIDLLSFAGADWMEFRQSTRQILLAERQRSIEGREPAIRPDPPPRHAEFRRLALKALRDENHDEAVRLIDEADAVAPELHGFLDGQEFVGLRDADDRFATVLEVFLDGNPVWFAWEAVQSVRFAQARTALDHCARPATVRMKTGNLFDVHLPLGYPGSTETRDPFGLPLRTFTDYICHENGPTQCIGAKLLLVGEDGEVPLEECRMIEIR